MLDVPGLRDAAQAESPRCRSFRTLFGTFKFYSPRLEHCDCTRRKTASFRPLSALLTESVAPELLYMEAKWSSLVSYGMSLDALRTFCHLISRWTSRPCAMTRSRWPSDWKRSWVTNNRLYRGCPSDWDLLPHPEGSFKVGIDGGYVRNWFAKKHNFEVIVGKSTLSFGEDEEDKTALPQTLWFCANAGYQSRNDVCMRCCTRKAYR